MPCRWYPSLPCRFPGPHPGGSLRGLAEGVSRPTPDRGLQAHTLGGVSQHALRQIPPCRRLVLRAVRILLECILVDNSAMTLIWKMCHRKWKFTPLNFTDAKAML